MIQKRFDRRMKQGSLGGLNLSYQKVELQSDIGHITLLLKEAKDDKSKADCE